MRWRELLFTGFYSGYCPVAPGTAGTLIAVLVYFLESLLFGTAGRTVNLIIVLVIMYPSIMLCNAGELFFNTRDPDEVVLDEMIGYWISVLFFPFNWMIVILAFILFRIFDIIKPYPIKKLEKLKGGFGIIIDDSLAGIYTNLLIRIIIYLAGLLHLQFF